MNLTHLCNNLLHCFCTDTIESVRSIGDYWIRLEKILPSTYSASSMPLSSPTQHINQSSSIVNQSNELFTPNDQLLNDEIYLYFDPSMNDGLEKRQMWLKGIELALKLERHRRRMGYHHHQQRSHFCENSGPTKSNMLDLFRGSNDVGSVRSALQRYAQETELFVIRQRQKDRIKLMTLFPDVRIRQDKFKMCSPHENNTIITSVKDSLSPFPERSIELCGRRFLATCLGLHSKLQANFETTGVSVSSHLENPEPYFVTMFLVDVNNGRRVSEDFYWDPNSPIVDSMLPAEQFKVLPWLHETNDNHNQSSSQHSNTVSSPTRTRRHAPPPPNNNLISPYGTQCSVSLSCLHKCRTALFSMPSCCHVNQLYIVVRVDKVLSGPINTVVEKYLKNCYNSINDNIKVGSSIQKSMVNYCRNIGRYRMPFAWGASSVNSTSHFIHLFKMDPNKTSELGLIQSVQMFSRLSTDSNYNNSLPTYQDCNTYPQNTTATTINSNDSGSSMHESNRYHIPESINHLLKIESNQSKSLKPNNNPSVLKDFMSYMTEQDRVFVEMVERSLKTQMLPLRFELVINELIDQDVDPNAQILSHDSNAPSRTGSLQRSGGYLVNSLNSNKNNRDSVLSNGSISSATGSLIVTNDLPKLINNTFQYQSNSLDRTDQSVVRLEHGTSVQSSTLKLLPFTSFSNTLYVCPKSLNLSGKHNFPRARNLSCFIELRSNDSLDNSTALKVFYTRPNNHQPIFDSWFNTSVMYHDTNPNFSENAKICLPLNLTAKHHLLFRFYHVSCETAATNLLSSKDKSNSNKKPVETSTGYSWMPILGTDGNLNVGTFQLRIAATIHPGYLQQSTIQNYRHSNQNTNGGTVLFSTANLNSNNTSNNNNINNSVDFNWIDNGKYLFKVNLKPFSSLYTHDPILSRFFRVCGDLLSRMLYLSPLKTMNTDKQKQNRVTFCDDTVVIQPNNVDVSSSSSKRISITNGISSSNSILHNATSIHLHICNAMKALLLISPTGLVQFLPIILNQFMEIIILSAEASAICTLTMLISELNAQIPNDSVYYPSKLMKDTSFLDGIISSNTSSGECVRHNLLKTYVEFVFNPDCLLTTCMNHYLNENHEITGDSTKFEEGIQQHELMLNKVTISPSLTKVTRKLSSQSIIGQFFPLSSLHHSIIRGLILILSDAHCPNHILMHLFNNIWFLLALIIKSMIQYLCISKKIWLIGSRLLSSSFGNSATNKLVACNQSSRNEELNTVHQVITSSNGLSSQPSGKYVNESLTPRNSLSSESVQHKQSTTSTKRNLLHTNTSNAINDAVDFNRIDFMSAIGQFLGQLFNIMDRGYVFKRVRDLLTFLEISPKMSVDKIDQLNELRFELLRCICEHEHFIQLNLPMLNMSDGLTEQDSVIKLFAVNVDHSKDGVELTLTDQFCQQHFIVGILLNQLSCLLSGCINTGSWAILKSTSTHQQYKLPITILRNLLIKHTLDPRYRNSKMIQARICSLYLPLIRLVLDNYESLGPPGGALQTAVVAAAVRRDYEESLLLSDGNSNSGTLNTSRRHRSTDKSSKFTKSNVMSHTIGHAGSASYRPQSMTSDYSFETISSINNQEQQNHHMNSDNGSYNSCLSRTSSSVGSNNPSFSQFIDRVSLSSDGQSTGNSAVESTTTSAAAAYLTKDGKVQKHILDQIAGVNQGGALQRVHRLRQLDNSSISQTPRSTAVESSTGRNVLSSHNHCPRSQSIHSVDSTQSNCILSSHASSSTLTLTGLDMDNKNNVYYNQLNGKITHREDNDVDSDSDIDDTTNDCKNDRIDRNQNEQKVFFNSCHFTGPIVDPDQDWAKQVLTLAGIYTDRVNDAKSVGSVKPHSGSTTSVEIPLDISVSEVESPLSDTVQQPPIYHHHLPTHQHHHRFNLQKVFIPELLLAKQPIIRPHIHRRPYELNNLDAPRRLTDNCQRDLYICLLHIMSTVTITHLKALLQSFTVQERLHFLNILRYSIQHLRYRGKHCIQQYEHISHSGVGRTGGTGHLLNISNTLVNNAGLRKRNKNWQNDLLSKSLLEDLPEDVSKLKVLLKANLATESSLIILDLLSTFSAVFKSELNTCKPCDPVFRSVLETYICILSNNPSDHVMRHTFSALRVFINQNAQVLFSESTDILSMLCLAGLRCSNQCFLSLSSFMSSLSDPSTATTTTCPMSNSTDSSVNLTPDSKSSQTLFSVGAVSSDAIPDKSKLITVPKLKSLEMNDINQTLLTTNHINNNNENDIDDNINQTLISRLCLDACGFLYRLWKCSFETHQQVGFHRVHLQTIIAISKLVTELSPGFEASLSLLHSLAQADMQRSSEVTTTKLLTTVTTASSSMKTTSGKLFWTDSNIRLFLDDIDDLIRRILTVLTATAEMRRHCDDPERIVDLQYALAKSYSSNPALRRTWLEELVKFHMNSRSFTELAMTKLHIAALMAEYLKRRGILACEFPQGCNAFKEISSNIFLEESGLREDSTTLEISYTQDDLLTDINEAALALESAGLFECIRPVYALILPVYEFKCQYTNLAQIYHHIGRTYEAISRVESQGHRLFATYYRVTFYGQVTYVEPYKETKDSNKKPLTSYAKHHDIHQFMFETPFLRQPGLSTEACLLASGPKRSDDLTIQWKRRTILTTEATFPHIRRRLEIIQVTETDFTPIDSAVDAIQCKNQELMSHVITLRNNLAAFNHSGDSTGNGLNLTANTSSNLSATVTMTTTSNNNNSNSNANNVKVSMNQIPLLMDMQLQGALLPTVNAGPMAYAQAFLKVENQSQYPASKVNQLKELFFDFLSTCLILLTYYYNLMSNVHEAKYRAMREALDRYRVDLSNLLKEEIIIDEKLLRIGPKSSTSCSTTLSRL
ncbi:Dedicator of cytokinesis protein 9 [Schistosoma japonicum]|nr:Dedicator of cytokinesis protein 9 [Schistosoma japonicum]